jgi:hypothetical protein
MAPLSSCALLLSTIANLAPSGLPCAFEKQAQVSGRLTIDSLGNAQAKFERVHVFPVSKLFGRTSGFRLDVDPFARPKRSALLSN